jgi:hypothetical protein
LIFSLMTRLRMPNGGYAQPAVPVTITALKSHRTRRAEERLRAGAAWSGTRGARSAQ